MSARKCPIRRQTGISSCRPQGRVYQKSPVLNGTTLREGYTAFAKTFDNFLKANEHIDKLITGMAPTGAHPQPDAA